VVAPARRIRGRRPEGCGMTPNGLAGQAVLVIGGSSGIGLEIARQAIAQDADVIIVARDATRLAVARERLGGDVRTAVVDAHEEAQVATAFSDLGALDHVVSMVGDSMSGGFLTTAPETMRHVLHSKFWSNWIIGRHAAGAIRAGGSLTFTSGTGGRPHEVSATAVANLGICALVEGLAYELAPRVRVNAVAPTFMAGATSFWKDIAAEGLAQMQAEFAETVPLKRTATPEQVASAYIHLMGNDFITGHLLPVDGGVMLAR
jgi:NAD(P)-dependent dehydrogenase (short-subunit alcohol dehydrogenase family)